LLVSTDAVDEVTPIGFCVTSSAGSWDDSAFYGYLALLVNYFPLWFNILGSQ
jgi:hypothetical protein